MRFPRFLRPVSALGFLALMLLALPGVSGQVPTEYTLSLNGQNLGIQTDYIAGARTVPAFNTTGLVLSYDMETLDAALMDDFSVEGNDGTISGSVDGPGIRGRSHSFDDATDEIDAGNGSSMGITTNISFNHWVRFDAQGTQFTLSKFNSYEMHYFTLGAGVRLDWLLYYSGGSTSINGFIEMSLDEWHMVTGVLDDSTMRTYVDGVADVTGAFGGSTILISTSNVHFGRRGDNSLPCTCDIDEATLWNRTLSPTEIGQLYALGLEYTFRFDSEPLVPDDLTVGETWLRGLNMTWGAENFTYTDMVFTANASAWGDDSFSWDSFSNISDADIGFNFTMPTGTYPYWVNDTFQANLTTAAGAIAFNWTDWIDGEHFFELGFNISSTPITSATVGLAYLYEPTIAKTNVTWSLETGPPFLAIDPSSGIIAGVPLAPQVAVVTIRATASGGLFLEQTFALIILEVGVLSDAQTMIIWLMTILMLVLFIVGPVFRMWFLWMLAGIDGILFGLFVFSALESFPLAIIIMGFGGFLLVGGILLTISQAVRGAIAGREV